MITNLVMNPQKANGVDAPRSIAKSGKYIGTIAQAEMHETKNGANILGLVFLCEGSTTFLNLCLTKADGTETFNMGILHAMMHILNVDSIQAVAGKVKNRKGEMEDGYRVPAIERKQIGLLLQRVNDLYNEKEIYNLNIVSVFDATSCRTSHEIQNNKEAKQIEARLEKLQDRTTDRLAQWKASGQADNGFESANRELQTTSNGLDDLGEDLPF